MLRHIHEQKGTTNPFLANFLADPWDTIFVFDEIDDVLVAWENLFNEVLRLHCPWRNKRVAIIN